MSIPVVPRHSWVEQIMGMPISLLARGRGAFGGPAEAAAAAVFAELTDVDALFSPYRLDSEVSRLARGELPLLAAHPLVQQVAARCTQARDLTDGLFDVIRPDGRWDPSGLVKGWAAERALRHLAAVPDLDWCLNAGGDVTVACPSDTPFTVGIQDPYDGSRVVATVPCAAGGVATSGTAARGHHLYDPHTGGVAALVASVTVTGPSLETADVLATAAFVAGGLALIEGTPGYQALCVALDGSLSSTTGWGGTVG